MNKPPPRLSASQRPRIVSDESVEKALDWMTRHATEIGEAKGEIIRLESRLKTVEAFESLRSDAKAQASRQAVARTTQEYKDVCEALAQAVAHYETLRNLKEAAIYKTEVWRSENAMRRNMM